MSGIVLDIKNPKTWRFKYATLINELLIASPFEKGKNINCVPGMVIQVTAMSKDGFVGVTNRLGKPSPEEMDKLKKFPHGLIWGHYAFVMDPDAYPPGVIIPLHSLGKLREKP